jgi:hypothetical protein
VEPITAKFWLNSKIFGSAEPIAYYLLVNITYKQQLTGIILTEYTMTSSMLKYQLVIIIYRVPNLTWPKAAQSGGRHHIAEA